MTNEQLDPAQVEWSRNHFRILRDGGTWAVPRSGLLFTKHGTHLELKARMPHDPKMPCSAAALYIQQQADFDIIKRHFEAAGIPVIDLSRN